MFLVEPFRPAAPGDAGPPPRLYRTGDLARWTGEGTLELLGRADRQIKLRGYRVEPGEIEQALVRHLGVREAAVGERRLADSHHVLCAYYVAEPAAPPLDDAAARARLAEVLPAYMVPAALLRVAELPRSANGKLEEARLPAPSFAPPPATAAAAPAASAASAAAAAAPASAVADPAARAADPAAAPSSDAPASETERTLLAMWSALFGLPPEAIGVSRNFFALGGHSLLMIQLLAEIDERFGRELPVAELFAEGTVRSLARVLDRSAP
jgi:acyl carrier protein